MDFLRHAQVGRMKFTQGSDVTTPVRWFRAAPDAKDFPTPHLFAATVWERLENPGDPEQPWQNTGIGDQSASNVRTGEPGEANFHGLVGEDFCGPLRAFQQGARPSDPPLVLDDDGVPVCCKRAEQGSGGQVTGGGEGPQASQLGTGGEALGAPPLPGGEVEGGAATQYGVQRQGQAGTGGEVLGAGIGDRVPTACCPADPFPRVMRLQIFDPSLLMATREAVYVPDSPPYPRWDWRGTAPPLVGASGEWYVRLECGGGTVSGWTVQIISSDAYDTSLPRPPSLVNCGATTVEARNSVADQLPWRLRFDAWPMIAAGDYQGNLWLDSGEMLSPDYPPTPTYYGWKWLQ